MVSPEETSYLILVLAFVELSIVKGDGERLQRRAREFLDHGGDKRGVQPSAEIGANWYIGAKPNAGSVYQKIEQFRCVLFLRGGRAVHALRDGREVKIPVRANRDLLVLYGQRVSGRKLQYMFENRPWRNGDPKCKDLIESDGIDFSGYAGNRKNRFDFGCKKERPIGNGVEKRPDPEPVAGKKVVRPRSQWSLQPCSDRDAESGFRTREQSIFMEES